MLTKQVLVTQFIGNDFTTTEIMKEMYCGSLIVKLAHTTLKTLCKVPVQAVGILQPKDQSSWIFETESDRTMLCLRSTLGHALPALRGWVGTQFHHWHIPTCTVYTDTSVSTWNFKEYCNASVISWSMILSEPPTLPYLTGKACYRLALRPLVGPMRIPELTVRLLKPLGVFSRLQEWAPVFLS